MHEAAAGSRHSGGNSARFPRGGQCNGGRPRGEAPARQQRRGPQAARRGVPGPSAEEAHAAGRRWTRPDRAGSATPAPAAQESAAVAEAGPSRMATAAQTPAQPRAKKWATPRPSQAWARLALQAQPPYPPRPVRDAVRGSEETPGAPQPGKGWRPLHGAPRSPRAATANYGLRLRGARGVPPAHRGGKRRKPGERHQSPSQPTPVGTLNQLPRRSAIQATQQRRAPCLKRCNAMRLPCGCSQRYRLHRLPCCVWAAELQPNLPRHHVCRHIAPCPLKCLSRQPPSAHRAVSRVRAAWRPAADRARNPGKCTPNKACTGRCGHRELANIHTGCTCPRWKSCVAARFAGMTDKTHHRARDVWPRPHAALANRTATCKASLLRASTPGWVHHPRLAPALHAPSSRTSR